MYDELFHGFNIGYLDSYAEEILNTTFHDVGSTPGF